MIFVTKSNTVIFLGKILVLVCGKYMKTIEDSIRNGVH